MYFESNKAQTRYLEQNILNLAYGKFESNNEWGIPELKRNTVEDLKNTPIQGFNYALSDKNPAGKGVHFFLHDYQFERVWNYPQRYTDVLSKFKFCLSPDFSIYSDMPEALKIYNVYRNRWIGRFWQEQGIVVIPTLTWNTKHELKYCCAGIPKHSIISVSTMGEGRWANYSNLLSTWDSMLEMVEPETILLYGKNLSPKLSGNIIYKQYITSSVIV